MKGRRMKGHCVKGSRMTSRRSRGSENPMKKTLIGGAAAATAATAVAAVVRGLLPDLMRYLRMRKM